MTALWLVSMALAKPAAWSPAKGTTLPALPAHGWREARVATQVRTYRTAIDSEGRLILAIQSRGTPSMLEIRRWDATTRAWEILGDRPLPSPDTPFAVTTQDAAVWIGLAGDTQIDVHQLPDWNVVWRTAPLEEECCDPFEIDGPQQTVVGFASPQTQPSFKLMAGTSARWTDLGPLDAGQVWGPTGGHLAITGTQFDAGPDRTTLATTWPATDVSGQPADRVLHRNPDGGIRWHLTEGLSALAGGNGRGLKAFRQAAFMSTHYGFEASRVTVTDEAGHLPKTALVLPPAQEVRVFETDPPLLAFQAADSVYVAAWNGTEWWGLESPGLPNQGIGIEGNLAPRVSLPNTNRVEGFVEDTHRGNALVSFERKGKRWEPTVWKTPTPSAQDCEGWNPPVYTSISPPGKAMAMAVRCAGSFDRHGLDGPTHGVRQGASRLEAFPTPPDCKGCVFNRAHELDDGSWLVSLLSGSHPPRLFRENEGRWMEESLPTPLKDLSVAAMVSEGPVAWVAFGTPYAFRVGRRDATGWSVLESPLFGSPHYDPRSSMFGLRPSPSIEMAVEDGAVHILRSTLLYIHHDGVWTEQRVTPLEDAPGAEPQLFIRRDGTPMVALLTATGIRVLERREQEWRGLDGSTEGRVWTGTPEGLAIHEDRKGKVCVAFTAWDARYRRTGVLCFR